MERPCISRRLHYCEQVLEKLMRHLIAETGGTLRERIIGLGEAWDRVDEDRPEPLTDDEILEEMYGHLRPSVSREG